MRPSFVTRPSYRGIIVFVSQAKQINDIFGFTVFAFLQSSAFSLNGNDLDVSGSMPCHYLLADSLVFRDLPDFPSGDISASKRIESLSFWLAIGPSTKIVLIRFHRRSLLAA
jgi:hypothetical protein